MFTASPEFVRPFLLILPAILSSSTYFMISAPLLVTSGGTTTGPHPDAYQGRTSDIETSQSSQISFFL